MNIREKVQFVLKALFLAALAGGVIYADVAAQMNFTENTRAGFYEAAYQRQLKGGQP